MTKLKETYSSRHSNFLNNISPNVLSKVVTKVLAGILFFHSQKLSKGLLEGHFV